MPEVFKNFILCMLETEYEQFIIPTVAYYSIYLFFPILIGTNIKSLNKFYTKALFKNQDVSMYVLLYCIFALATAAILVQLGREVYTKFKNKTDELKKDLTCNDNDIENGVNNEVKNKEDDAISQAESSKILKM